jgi:hypothetical protein
MELWNLECDGGNVPLSRKDYIYSVDRLGTKLLEYLYTEKSNFELKPKALRIRDSPDLDPKHELSLLWRD